ncbi:hypothetical protein U9M48_016867 [Paspalum notatum var. saurae]|uniref:Uncharacterized protein n=1 Tax=Paspalum notatum var. saurae TaxID=547442 RepID=A0AAQ3T9T8_PASNO
MPTSATTPLLKPEDGAAPLKKAVERAVVLKKAWEEAAAVKQAAEAAAVAAEAAFNKAAAEERARLEKVVEEKRAAVKKAASKESAVKKAAEEAVLAAAAAHKAALAAAVAEEAALAATEEEEVALVEAAKEAALAAAAAAEEAALKKAAAEAALAAAAAEEAALVAAEAGPSMGACEMGDCTGPPNWQGPKTTHSDISGDGPEQRPRSRRLWRRPRWHSLIRGRNGFGLPSHLRSHGRLSLPPKRPTCRVPAPASQQHGDGTEGDLILRLQHGCVAGLLYRLFSDGTASRSALFPPASLYADSVAPLDRFPVASSPPLSCFSYPSSYWVLLFASVFYGNHAIPAKLTDMRQVLYVLALGAPVSLLTSAVSLNLFKGDWAWVAGISGAVWILASAGLVLNQYGRLDLELFCARHLSRLGVLGAAVLMSFYIYLAYFPTQSCIRGDDIASHDETSRAQLTAVEKLV